MVVQSIVPENLVQSSKVTGLIIRLNIGNQSNVFEANLTALR